MGSLFGEGTLGGLGDGLRPRATLAAGTAWRGPSPFWTGSRTHSPTRSGPSYATSRQT